MRLINVTSSSILPNIKSITGHLAFSKWRSYWTLPSYFKTNCLHLIRTVKSRQKQTPLSTLRVVSLCFVGLFAASCAHHDIENGHVFYVSWNEGNGQSKKLIIGADAQTFTELDHPKYAVDNQRVYYEAKLVKGADPQSFVALLDYYGKDKRHAYKEASQIADAAANTFEVLDGGPYSKDQQDYYFDTIALKVHDYQDFVILNNTSDFGLWAKDKTHYFLNGRKFPLRDYASFTTLAGGYAKDDFQVYFLDSMVVGADPSTFKVREFGYAQDKSAQFEGRKRLPIQDPQSYQILPDGFTKDRLHVYSKGAIVRAADPATFTTLSWAWQKDKSHYFYHGKLMPAIDYKSFTLLQDNYAKDKNSVYYYDAIVAEADPSTFEVDEMTYVGRDKSGCYQAGEKVDCQHLKDE